MASHQNYPSMKAEFIKRFPNNERNTIHSILQSVARASGSRWNVTHLEACRVCLSVPKRPKEQLEVLQPFHERARLHMETLPDVLSSLKTVSSGDLKQCSSARLREIGGHFGAFYSRLAEVTRMPQPVRRTRPARDIHRPSDPDFVTGEGLGFSSPLGTEGSGRNKSSSFSTSEGDPIDRSDHELRKKHEAVTTSMAAEFISSVLDLCSDQPNSNSRIEFNIAPTTYALDTPYFNCTCQDDGCLIRRNRNKVTGTWITYGSNLAVVECKAQYTTWNEDEDIASVSTNVLGQQVCEMISSRIGIIYNVGDLTPKDRHVFLLSVHQSSLSFMHWAITDEYFKYFVSDEPGPLLPFLELYSSSTFNLEKADERLEAAHGIIALTYFLDEGV